MSVDPRAKALSALARFQVTGATVGGTLERIAAITLEAMPSAAIAGMTMLGEDGQLTTAIYTNPESPEIDAAPGLGADDAFELLRKASQRENVKLAVIAQRIIDRRTSQGGTS